MEALESVKKTENKRKIEGMSDGQHLHPVPVSESSCSRLTRTPSSQTSTHLQIWETDNSKKENSNSRQNADMLFLW